MAKSTDWKDWEDIATAHGVKYGTFWQRVTHQKMEPMEAATRPVKSWADGQKRSRFPYADSKRGRVRATRLPSEFDAVVDEAIAKSGLSQQDWIALQVIRGIEE